MGAILIQSCAFCGSPFCIDDRQLFHVKGPRLPFATQEKNRKLLKVSPKEQPASTPFSCCAVWKILYNHAEIEVLCISCTDVRFPAKFGRKTFLRLQT